MTKFYIVGNHISGGGAHKSVFSVYKRFYVLTNSGTVFAWQIVKLWSVLVSIEWIVVYTTDSLRRAEAVDST